MSLLSTVRYCPAGGPCPYQNAFWNGTQMVYGEGLTADDVVAHELTHGFTENTSNLFYVFQSGAISESLSDMWGEFVDQANGTGDDSPGVEWQIGEDTVFGAIRSMSNPPTFGDPDRMGHANYVEDNLSVDNGGVHSNSGVNNKAAYLMVDGGTFNGRSVSALGMTKVSHIYYEAQTSYLTSASDYMDLYNALYQSCLNLVGTNGIVAGDCAEVRDATEAVEMHLQPATNYNPDVTNSCSAGQAKHTSFSDDFEGGLANWTLSHNNSLTNLDWSAWLATYGPFGWGPNATSGVESLFGLDVDTTADQYAEITVNVPEIRPYLHFRHAFDFEPPNYDGGVVEYSTNGGASWTDASGLFNGGGQGYKGSISALFGNPLAARNAFVDSSHGYVSTRLNLNSLANSSVKFRWRLGTDGSIGWFGWWLDDVQVYSCNSIPTISAISDRTIDEDNDTGAVGFQVGDADTGAALVNVTGVSSNTTLVPNGNIVFGGSGTNRTVTVTPVANLSGSTDITITADDGQDTAQVMFTLTVNPVNDLPGMTSVADQVINEDGSTPALAITLSDVDSDVNLVSLSGSSSKTNLVPNGNIVFGGSGTNRTVTVTPAANRNGTTSITITADDGQDTSQMVFALTVNAVNDTPSTPVLVSPVNNATAVDSTRVTFDWDEATDADGDRVTYSLHVCEDAGLTVNCLAPVSVSVLENKILYSGLGGGSVFYLGLLGLAHRRRLLRISAVLMLMSLLGSCSSGGGGGPSPAPTATDLMGLSPGMTYYWKVTAMDGNGGNTDSAIWSFTTAP